MRKIGYVRVSSQTQNKERQLMKIGMDIIYQEKISGETLERKELIKLLENLENGDIIFVTNLTRSTKDLFLLIETIKKYRNCHLKIESEFYFMENKYKNGCNCNRSYTSKFFRNIIFIKLNSKIKKDITIIAF